jgi:hypothetical protein
MTDKPQPSPQPDVGDGSAIGARHRAGLPYRKGWPLLLGALMGVALRLIYSGDSGWPYAPMEAGFIYFVPVAVGAVTVYVAESIRRRTWGYYLWAPVVANALFVLGTMLLLIEGLICVVIALPLFCALGAIGGLLMGAACRLVRKPKGVVYGIGALPLLVGLVPPTAVDPLRIMAVERTVAIDAAPDVVWQHLHHTIDIQPHEMDHAWLYRIGVPLPKSGLTERTPQGPVRKVTMGKSIHFEQVATEWIENRHVRWVYRFSPDSFPPNALDDHVRIGGRYFDLIDTSYTLTARPSQPTLLTVRMHYRVTTSFNWYADRVASVLVEDFEEAALAFYRARAERGPPL